MESARTKSLHSLVEAQVHRQPDATALSCGDVRLSWSEFDSEANRLANWLVSHGTKPGSRVGIFLERSTSSIVAILSVLKSGAAYVPLDVDHPDERLAMIEKDAAISHLITTETLRHRIPHDRAATVCLDSDATVLRAQSCERPEPRIVDTDLAYVIYTSGSTGRSKGVEVAHHSVVHLIRATQPIFGFGPEDRWTLFHSCAFDLSVWEIFGCLAAGGTLIVVPAGAVHSPAALYQLLLRERVTVLSQTPSGIQMLLYWMEHAGHAPDSLHLRLIACGGEIFPTTLALKLLEWNIPLWNFYGPTEATVWAACGDVRKLILTGASVPIGHPIAGYTIRLLDEHYQPVRDGELGEIHISGPGLAVGYRDRPELTAEKFVRNPHANGSEERLYKTGDLGRRLADETIECIGRVDFQVKIRGFRIESAEVEAVVQQHGGVASCAVISEAERLIAFVVPRPGVSLNLEELRRFVAKKLPHYAVPARFVILEQLPLSTNRKLDRKRLAEVLLHQRIPSAQSAAALAEQIRLIYEDIFGKRPLDVRDNFFELGGDSLLATNLCTDIEEELGYNFRAGVLYQAPTPQKLADLLFYTFAIPAQPLPIVLQERGTHPPLFCMNVGAGNLASFYSLARYLGPDQPSYGLVVPEVDDGSGTDTSIEAIAAAHFAAIRTVQPHGPYYLAGVSSGGIVAFELACEMTRQGEEVGFLAFLDASAGVDEYTAVAAHVRVFRNLSYWQRLPFVARKVVRMARKIRPVNREAPLSPEAIRFQGRIGDAHRFYKPGTYPNEAVLFRATESLLCFDDGGWASLIAGGLRIEEVPGDHTYLLEEPYLGKLAQRLRVCLDRAATRRNKVTPVSANA
jgi:amino acid adenylation domain-containing protein